MCGERKVNISLGRGAPEKNVAKNVEGGNCQELLTGNKAAERSNLSRLAHK